MPRTISTKAMTLQCSPLAEAHAAGRTPLLQTLNLFPGMPNPAAAPVALRWSLNPRYGIPRKVFSVYRRLRRGGDLSTYGHTLALANVALNDAVRIEWNNVEYALLAVRVKPTVGGSVTLTPIDVDDQPIPGQAVTVTLETWVVFRASGIAALRSAGAGTLVSAQGITLDAAANAMDWGAPIQKVGIPFLSTEITAAHYEIGVNQGFTSAPLMSGHDFALRRLQLAEAMHLPYPALAGAALPAWGFPDETAFLQKLRTTVGPDRSLLHAMAECLKQTDDADISKQQRHYIESRSLSGIAQVGQSPVGTLGAELPIPGLVQAAVASDGPTALALGFGTLDVTPTNSAATTYSTMATVPGGVVWPPGWAHLAYEYMVTVEVRLSYRYPLLIGPVTTTTLELAAISYHWDKPADPTGLAIERVALEPPPGLDLPRPEPRSVSWKPPARPVSYAVAARRPGVDTQARLLNTSRGSMGGYIPLRPEPAAKEDGSPAVDARLKLLDRFGTQPLNNNQLTRYSVIALDHFGRWSNWLSADYTSVESPMQAPGLPQVHFEPSGLLSPHVLGGTLYIDFSWDWRGRSCASVWIHGHFYAGTDPGPASGFSRDSTQAPGAEIEIAFTNEVPQVVPGPFGTDVGVVALAGDDPNLRRYRVTVLNARATFSAGQGQLRFAAFAQGRELVRPNDIPDFVGPRSIPVADPTAPVVTVAPPFMDWTSLPDVSGKARFKLDWLPVDGAVGYTVWTTNESALHQALGLDPPDLSIEPLQRTVPLRAMLDDPAAHGTTADAIASAFTRINGAPQPGTSRTVELPGDAAVLSLYRISAVSAQAIESPPAPGAFIVGVPRPVVPPAPRLLGRVSEQPGQEGAQLTVVPGEGVSPQRLRVFRVRRPELARELGTMGPPLVELDVTAWAPVEVPLVARPDPLHPPLNGLRWIDPVPPSWFPYCYRVQARAGLGQPNLDNGRLPGTSAPSTALELRRPPPGPPSLQSPSVVSAAQSAHAYTLSASVPSRRSPYGPARIELLERADDGTVTLLAAGDTDQLERLNIFGLPARLTWFAAQPPGQPPAQIVVHPGSDPDVTEFSVLVRAYPVDVQVERTVVTVDPVTLAVTESQVTQDAKVVGDRHLLRVIDPLGRSADVSLTQPTAP